MDKLESEHLLSSIQEKYPINENGFLVLDELSQKKLFHDGFKYVLGELKQQYPDVVGILTVPETNVYYPITQSSDNKYYIEHLMDGTNNKSGWPFMDYRNTMSSDNIVIYGHNRSDGSMFGSLKHLLNNPETLIDKPLTFQTMEEDTRWQVFSIYTIPSEIYYIKTNFNYNNEYVKWLQTMKSRSVYDFNNEPASTDKVITLSTCYGLSAQNKRLVIHAKKI